MHSQQKAQALWDDRCIFCCQTGGIVPEITQDAVDMLDGLVAAEVQTETVEHFAEPQPDEERRTLEDTEGIPTGVAFDIHKQIELRRAKRAASPDDLAPEKPHVRQYVQVNVLAAPHKLAPPPPDSLLKDAPDNPA